jgi:hypothetical protein
MGDFMPPTKPAAAPAASRPPRYDDAVASATSAAPGSAASATTNAPAGAVRGGDAAQASFALDVREDDPGDRDLVSRRPRVKDLIAQRLELDESPSYGDRFDWCRDEVGSRYQFSRRYAQASVLVDLFPVDNQATRGEVARKRAAIEKHNAAAKATLEQLLESSSDDTAYEAGVTFLRQRGDLPFGYLPMVGMPMDLDVAALKGGAILDLPPLAAPDPFVPSGVGVSRR